MILPIEDYEEMLEDLHFGEVGRESKDEEKRDLTEVVKDMRENGEINIIR